MADILVEKGKELTRVQLANLVESIEVQTNNINVDSIQLVVGEDVYKAFKSACDLLFNATGKQRRQKPKA